MNILFISPPTMPLREIEAMLSQESILRVPNFLMPLGLLELSAYLRRNISNLKIQILDMGKDLYKDKWVNKLAINSVDEFIENKLNEVEFIPDIVGVSILCSTSYNFCIKTINKIKNRWGKTIVVCGGNHATNDVNNLLSNPNIDYVVRGEGELSFLELVNKFMDGNGIDVYGVIDKKKISINQLSPMLKNLNDISLPAYDLLDLESYKIMSRASMMFSRGCFYRCTFCSAHTVHGKKVRFRSPDVIIKSIKYLVEQCEFKRIAIYDDLLGFNKEDFIEVAKRIKELNYPTEFDIPNAIAVNIFDEERVNALRMMGVKSLCLSIESGSAFTQKYIIKKNANLNKAKRLLQYIREQGFEEIRVNFIMGFPDETKKLMEETINYIKSLDVDWTYILLAVPVLGSEMFEQMLATGILSDSLDYDGMRYGKRTFDTPEISAQDLETLVYDTNIECNYFNNSNVRNRRYDRAIYMFTKLILALYPFHIIARYCRAMCYMKLGEREKAVLDLKECVRWISTNDESKRLYKRYGAKMPELTSCMPSGPV